MVGNDEILRKITQFYLDSGDFNGIPIKNIVEEFRMEEIEFKEITTSLILDKRISLNFGSIGYDPCTKVFWEDEVKVQIEKLKESNLEHICAYPTASHLKEVIDPSVYLGRPFTLRLALGEPQLSFQSFDLSVLDLYRNNLQYDCLNDDVSGTIKLRHPYCYLGKSSSFGQALLQTFGFSYDSKLNRAVAVFLRYLSDLDPEHQQMWYSKKLEGNYKLHPYYLQKFIIGDSPGKVIFSDSFLHVCSPDRIFVSL
jgi:hypothetical protein